MSRTHPRRALPLLVAAFMLAVAAVGIATAKPQPRPTGLAAVRDAATGLPTGQRTHKPF
ncbi:hypothetical protein OM076_39500 [Solirubrobacter ginsenosidimutans]|uniref:Uncharacterized protein n=1 Tax=Solirubrobacter ginsenosidimutans TaxID=490573 RepID=A0A9X3N4B5_9ACTN|nr:hypothetical protein [Solirubrobacter ginsenosidimutans]MDA0166417.1 hypothetical protein [Solirubrobacter ginsenosidimutans]